jgi:hypothetical protein
VANPTRRRRIWQVGWIVFSVVNVIGGAQAAGQGEARHAFLHALLAFVGIIALQRVGRPRLEPTVEDRELAERLARLERTIDTMAVEVERVGEGQRYLTKLYSGDRDAAEQLRRREPGAP